MTWRTVRLGEIFEIARGGSPRPIDEYISDAADAVNWISIKDATESSKYIRKTKLKIRPDGVSKSRLVGPGDLLLTNSMSFGRPYIMATTGCIHDGWLMLTDRSGMVDANFFFHLLGSELVYAQFSRLAAGAVVKNLNIDLVKTVEVPLPPLSEQRRIARVLDEADRLRRLRATARARSQRVAPALFISMFGEPSTWRSSGISLGDCVQLRSGSTPSKKEPDYWNGGVPWVSPKDMKRPVISSTIDSVSAESLDRTALRLLPAGTTLLVVRGMILARTVPVARLGVPATINQDMKGLFPRSSSVSHQFIYGALVAARMQLLRLVRTAGHGTKKLNTDDLLSFPVPEPTVDLVSAFTSALERLDAYEGAVSDSTPALDSLFLVLRHRGCNGELTAGWRRAHVSDLHDEIADQSLALRHLEVAP